MRQKSFIWVPSLSIVWSKFLPRLGMLFYILSRLGSIRKRTNLQKPKVQKLKLRLKEQSRTAKSQAPKSRATKAHIEQTETCRRAEVRDTLWTCWGRCRFRKWQRIPDWQVRQICKNFLAKNFSKIIKSIPRRQVLGLISLLWFHIWNHMHWNTWFQEIFTSEVKTRQRHFVNFNFRTSVSFFSGLRRLRPARPWLPEHHLESRSDLSLPVRQAWPGLSGLFPVYVADSESWLPLAVRHSQTRTCLRRQARPWLRISDQLPTWSHYCPGTGDYLKFKILD